MGLRGAVLLPMSEAAQRAAVVSPTKKEPSAYTMISLVLRRKLRGIFGKAFDIMEK